MGQLIRSVHWAGEKPGADVGNVSLFSFYTTKLYLSVTPFTFSFIQFVPVMRLSACALPATRR